MNQSDIYKEACNSFRHYSSASTTIRVSALAQGVVLLSASGYLYRIDELLFSSITSGFGAFFTVFLAILHMNYQDKAEVFITAAADIEETCEEMKVKAVHRCLEQHKLKVKNPIGELFVVRGVFFLLFLAFLAMSVWSAIQC